MSAYIGVQREVTGTFSGTVKEFDEQLESSANEPTPILEMLPHPKEFSKLFTAYPRYTLTLPRPILPPNGYPRVPRSFGEHLRKKRPLDLGLLQAQVAQRMGSHGVHCMELRTWKKTNDAASGQNYRILRLSS